MLQQQQQKQLHQKPSLQFQFTAKSNFHTWNKTQEMRRNILLNHQSYVSFVSLFVYFVGSMFSPPFNSIKIALKRTPPSLRHCFGKLQKTYNSLSKSLAKFIPSGEQKKQHTGWYGWSWDVHPRGLTCPLKWDYFNRKYIFQPLIFRGHVSFPGSTLKVGCFKCGGSLEGFSPSEKMAKQGGPPKATPPKK